MKKYFLILTMLLLNQSFASENLAKLVYDCVCNQDQDSCISMNSDKLFKINPNPTQVCQASFTSTNWARETIKLNINLHKNHFGII